MFVVALVSFFVLVYFWLNGTALYRSENKNVVEEESLYCTLSGISEDGFFNLSYDAVEVLQTIKIALNDGRPDKITYSYDGKYENEERALSAQSFLHGDYNVYMSSQGLNQEYLFPTFTTINNITRINLYADANMLNPKIATFFFLDNESYMDILERSIDTIKKEYNEKGFSCDY